MRDRRLEYVLDRKEWEIRELREKLLEIEAQRESYNSTVIVAEVILFLLGIAIGALMMRTFVN